MEKQLNLPKLRFPEFEGAWEKKKLGEITNKINSGKTPLGGESVYVEYGIIFIRSQNVLENELSIRNSTYITESVNNTMRNSIVMPNDILLNITGASLGRSCVVPNDFQIGNVNQHVCIIRINNQNNPRFIQPVFASEKGQNLFTSLQTGSGREGLNFQSIKGISLFYPCPSEQTKIATFLSAVDDKLQALKKKKSLLEEYKKGVMQKLFSQELRFKDKDGDEFPEWEEKKMNEICKSISSGKTKPELDGAYLVYGSTGVIGLSTSYTHNGKFLLVARVGANAGTINIANGMFCVTDNTLVIEVENNVDIDYIYYSILDFGLNKLVFGSGQPLITGGQVKSLIINFPCLPEQIKIASFLTSIDEKIKQCSGQIEKTEEWKKGMLQQMFV